MKKLGICCFAVLCMVLSGCGGAQQEPPKADLPEQMDVQPEVQDAEMDSPTQAEEPDVCAEPDAAPGDDAFSGRWQAAETPQYYMDISGGEGSYTIEIIWSGGSQGDTVWQLTGTYDEIWGGIAYTGAKYEDIVDEKGTVERKPVPEREEITGLIYLEKDGALYWIDDFDHTGDDMSFQKE